MFLYGKIVAESLKEELKEQVKEFKMNGLFPKLAIVQLCKDDSLEIYFNTRKRIAEELGIEVILCAYENKSFEEIKEIINDLNNNDEIWGIMIDDPIPDNLDKAEVRKLIIDSKDAEGANHNNGLRIPTAQAIKEIIEYYHIDVKNSSTTVLGNSSQVGHPIYEMIKEYGGVVYSCNSKTSNADEISKHSDITIVAIGRKELIDSKYVSENSVLFDIGTHYDDEGKVCGDVKKECYEMVKDVCPSPKGVGPVTNVCLFKNLLKLRG